MDSFIKANRDFWDELALLNVNSDLYDVKSFKNGKSSLKPIELEELKDVKRKTLLHLQCHFGMDTISWARLGAKVTGVDFSDKAIQLAKSISQELGIETKFICSNIYDLPSILEDKFDIVFTSYGVLCWLPDIRRWAKTVSHFLKPGGIFYIVEFHPFLSVFDDRKKTGELKVCHSYFYSTTPNKDISDLGPESAYGDKKARVSSSSYEWTHSLGDIINALISEGLKIEFLHEFPYCSCNYFWSMEKGKDGLWRLKGGRETIPLMFSLKATK